MIRPFNKLQVCMKKNVSFGNRAIVWMGEEKAEFYFDIPRVRQSWLYLLLKCRNSINLFHRFCLPANGHEGYFFRS